MRAKRSRKILLVLVILISAILLFLSRHLFMLKVLASGKPREVFVTFPVSSSAVKGFKFFIEPLRLDSGEKGALLVRFNKRSYVGDVNNPGSLRWNAPRQGISIIDLRWPVLADGQLDSWSIYSMRDNVSARFKVWRKTGDSWLVVGGSELVVLKKGVNSFYLGKEIEVKQGDYLGFFTLQGQISLRPQVSFPPFIASQSLTFSNKKLFFLGDVERGLGSDVTSDNEGGYCVKAYYRPKEIARFIINAASLRQGYYSFFSPLFINLQESMVEIAINLIGTAGPQLSIGLLPSLENSLLSETRNFYIAPIYASKIAVSDYIVPPDTNGKVNFNLIIGILCAVFLLSLARMAIK